MDFFYQAKGLLFYQGKKWEADFHYWSLPFLSLQSQCEPDGTQVSADLDEAIAMLEQ